MSNSNQVHPDQEIERLRMALDEETRRCLAVQRQLDRAGAEFEEFVSMAAHNLREHLREVVSFSQLIAETYAGRLDSDADVFLEHILRGAAGMESLLADIVDYWAAGAGDLQAFPTDMEAVLSQALLSTEKWIAERGAIVTHDPLPPVCGDFEMLSNVLRHLIRNAIEYCGATSPRVHISSRRADLDWAFSVTDNGPGIESAFQARVFEVFKRLHRQEQPGNGLGLAFCQRVIKWHGGRMWIESTPGTGSTFYFTLPAAD